MRIAAVMVLAAAILVPATVVKADSAEDVFRQFGLFGNWAPHCGQPAAPDNPHVGISAPGSGVVEEDHDLGSGFAVNRYRVLSAQRLSAERMKVAVTFQPGTESEERQTLIFRVRRGTRRTLFNQPDGGRARVKGGIMIGHGGKTALLRKCE
jgi:hypothetical protein